MFRTKVLLVWVMIAGLLGLGTMGMGGAVVPLVFDFPVSVAGPLADKVESLTQRFNDTHPGIEVTPVFAGGYNDTLVKSQAGILAGSPPDIAVLLSTDLFTLRAQDAIIPLDDFINGDADGQAYIDDFLPAFMANSKTNGQIWSIPFQRSTPVLFYNKDAFREVGLDPESPPQNWDELVADGQKLKQVAADGTVKRWGLEVPFSGGFIWNFEAFIYQTGGDGPNEVKIVSDDGTEVDFTNQHVLTALNFFKDLSTFYKIMPNGNIGFGAVPTDFLAGTVGMIYHSTGSLTFILSNATFDVGVAPMPGLSRFGTPTGGGNFYIFKGIPQDHQQAAWTFIRWMTAPEQVAEWSLAGGYVASNGSSYQTDLLSNFTATRPEYLVARDQLQFAHKEFSSFNRVKITKILFDQLTRAVLGEVSPEEALQEAQAQATKELAAFK